MKIVEIKHVTSKAGRPMVLVVGAEKDIWLTAKQFTAKGGSSILDSYVGGNIEADFYNEGDVLQNNEKCTKDGVILRDFSISVNPIVSARALAAEQQMRMDDANSNAALFARKRAESKVKEENKDVVA